MEEIKVIQSGTRRLKVFVDFWNLLIQARSVTSYNVDFSWDALPEYLIAETKANYWDKSDGSLAGCFIFGSYDRSNPEQMKLVDRTLDKYGGEAGLFFDFKERVGKEAAFKCSACGVKNTKSSESGVDVLLSIEMIKHALMRDHEYISLVSNDRDYLPLLQYLKDVGQRVLHVATGEPLRDMRAATWKQVELRSLYPNLVSMVHDDRIVVCDPNSTAQKDDAIRRLSGIGANIRVIDITNKEQISDRDLTFLVRNQNISFGRKVDGRLIFGGSNVLSNIEQFRRGVAAGEYSAKLPYIINEGRQEASWQGDRWIPLAPQVSTQIWKD